MWKNLSVAGLVAVFFTLVVPLQSYWGNADQLPIGFGELACELAACFAVAVAVLLALLTLLRGRSGSVARIVLLALVFAAYLETGVLSLGCPALDGGTEYYENISRGILDAVLLLAGVLLVVLLKSYWKVIALALFVLSVASLLDTGHRSSASVSAASGQALTANASVVKSCFHSSRRNIAMYVLDCVTTSHALHVLEQDPELARAFDGFTCFTNSIGMSDCTVSAIAGITTGQYLERPDQQVEYAATCFSSNSFLQAYAEAGIPVFFRPGSFCFGMVANAPIVEAEEDDFGAVPRWALAQRIQDQQRWNLLEIVGFRLTPFALKSLVYRRFADTWAEKLEAASLGYLSFCERWAYPLIAQAPVREDIAQTLQFWHTEGSHPPLGVNRHGERDGVSRSFYDQRVEKTWYVLSELAKLLRTLKQRGVYDQTFFIVMADHGREPLTADGKNAVGGAPARAQPILWIKPMNAHGQVTYSSEPVSQRRIHDLMLALLRDDLDATSAGRCLREERRLYRAVEGDDLIDYVVDILGRATARRHTVAVSHVEDLPPVDLGRRYRLTGQGVDAGFPARFERTRFYDGGGPRMVVGGSEAKIVFRVPDGCSSCEITLAAEIWRDGQKPELVLIDPRTGARLYRLEGEKLRRRIKFTVEADASGLVSFAIYSPQYVGLQWIEVRAAGK